MKMPKYLRTPILLWGCLSLMVMTLQSAISTDRPANIFYATPSGTGSACSETIPCSLSAARDKIRTINTSMSGDIIVYLRDGVYQLTNMFTLDQSDSGSGGHNIIYQAFPGERPIISGGRTITGWSQVSGSNIWESVVGTSLQTRQLYVNGTRAIRAVSQGGLLGTLTKTTTGYITNDTSLQSWSNPSDIEFVYTGAGGAGANWRESRCGVASISGDSNSTTITMKEPCYTNASTAICAFHTITYPTRIENAKPLLDQPGEWYLDSSIGILYYIPRPGEDMSVANVVAPILETLVKGTGTSENSIHNIEFYGLTFAYATWLGPSNHCC